MTRFRRHERTILLALTIGAVGACAGPPSSTPSGVTPPASETPSAPAPASPSLAVPSIAAETESPSPFAAASQALGSLDSYEYVVELYQLTNANNAVSGMHSVISGVTIQRPEPAHMTLTKFFDIDGKLTGEQALIVIGQRAWVRDGGAGMPWSEADAASVPVYVKGVADLDPAALFAMYVEPSEGRFATIGSETKDGAKAIHYQGDLEGASFPSFFRSFDGAWTSDAWIADDGGYLVAYEAKGTAAGGSDAGTARMTLKVSKPNAARSIDPPT